MKRRQKAVPRRGFGRSCALIPECLTGNKTVDRDNGTGDKAPNWDGLMIGRVDCGVVSPSGQVHIYYDTNLIQMTLVAGRRQPVLFLHRYQGNIRICCSETVVCFHGFCADRYIHRFWE